MNYFPTTKKEILKNLEDFSKNEILNYSSNRNYDLGIPHKNVSKLSPYIRRRFISEEEVMSIILKDNEINKIEKFIEEIFWRTYWRGWLETHPWIYNEYLKNNETKDLLKKTGIKCFDHWVDELLETGYLHNHARMWFASIWIFTLGYSWQSGAKFFENNLLDFCPASNTLGWRWVAGIQTIGKPYIARAENIRDFTKNRFYPKDQLNNTPNYSFENFSNGKASKFLEPKTIPFEDLTKVGLILNNNDLSLNKVLDKKGIKYNCCLWSTNNQNPIINNFQKLLYEDVCNNLNGVTLISDFETIFHWIQNKGIKNLILPYETVGNKIFSNRDFLNTLELLEVSYYFYLREWDQNAFPHCTRGFFNFKKMINELINHKNIFINAL